MEKKSLNDMQKEEHLGSSLRICRVQKYLRWPSFTPFLDILLSYETFRASYLMDSSDFRPSRRDERERELTQNSRELRQIVKAMEHL